MRKILLIGLVGLCVALGYDVAGAQDSNATNTSSRKNIRPVEYDSLTPSTENRSKPSGSAAKEVDDSLARPNVKLATPANAEQVLRTVLANVNSGKTEIVIRASEWDGAESAHSKELDKARNISRVSSRSSLLSSDEVPLKADSVKWGYGPQNGPQQWSSIDPSFKACSQGRLQSPIDIWSDLAIEADSSNKTFAYSTVGVRFAKSVPGQLRIRAQAGAAMMFQGNAYYLETIEFRLPGEGRIDGVAPVMSVYLRHRSSEGKTAIVSVPVRVGSAADTNPALETLWFLTSKGGRATDRIDANQLLPAKRGYYHYVGSLTQPPCSEGVQWIVLHDPITISRAQYVAYARSYQANARPSQPLAGRSIVSYRP